MLMKTIPLRQDGHGRAPQEAACPACEVRGRALFGTLDAQALNRVHHHITPQEYVAGETLYGAGRSGVAVYTLRRGVVRFERVTKGGARRVVRLAGPGDLIGQEALLGRPYAEEAVACTAVHLCRIPTPVVTQMIQDDAAVRRAVLTRWQQALEQAEDWVTELTTGLSRRRFVVLLGRIAAFEPGSDLIWLPRREEIGAMLDITMETASRLVSALKREGVIELLPPSHARLDRIRWRQALAQLDG
jgi:CRP-like cAMP-binding protein